MVENEEAVLTELGGNVSHSFPAGDIALAARFWGVRGSLPASCSFITVQTKIERALKIAVAKGLGPESDIKAFVRDSLDFATRGAYGTNTSCVQIEHAGDDLVVCDAGSGIRDLGHQLMKQGAGTGRRIHIFLSHLHWDHIQGFPFFAPAYVPGNRITVYGAHTGLAEAFQAQQRPPGFPVPFSDLGADIDFVELSVDEKPEIAGLSVTILEQRHPGISYGYRFGVGGRCIVYSTDSEHKSGEDGEDGFLEFCHRANLLIFDAQYQFAEANLAKEDWGHSNNLVGVELAKAAEVAHLCLFHLEPTVDDHVLQRFLEDTRRYSELAEGWPLQISMAYEGLVINV